MTIKDIEEAEQFVFDGKVLDPDTAKVPLTVSMPVSMKVAIENYVQDNKLNLGAFCRQVLASAVGFSYTETGRAKKASLETEDEKKARVQARAKAQRDMIKAMLAKVRAEEGIEVEDDEDEDDEA